MVNILEEIGLSRSYTLHSHTQFCDGRAQMEAFAAAAVAAGFTHYGFSPHSPLPFCSPCNMHKDNVDVYLAEVGRLRGLYDGLIRFYASMEIDYIDRSWNAASDYFAGLPLDYRISSVHFIPSEEGPVDVDGRPDSFVKKVHRYFDGDIYRVVNTFFDKSLEMVETGGFEIVGHFDKIGHNASFFSPGIEDEPWYERRIDELVEAIARRRGLIVEINTKAFAEHGRLFPHPRWWSKLRGRHVPIVVNSDAHVPALIDASRSEAWHMLEAAGMC